ncbi:HtaA domain-containing protein [Solirubrobacter sp. CPCC 204708]|uniref:HtaA domain-containing protein n=1 Tax=Solirubrobacter deserti TaxID=2282478 RepID=A0ABT4RF76_9ACTN|nr:HtaA domain-containing protein [Solirubrobacter deserti]MBE2319526.1 HtaA domain-containing protein [Solirubrobacter deserti]MDA0137187.1 HtaA domain-containing protein [Solirubrobacter deserti]
MLSRQLLSLLDKRVAVAAALAGLAFATPARAQDVTTGHLDWGLKASFRTYIAGPIAHGSITLSEGVTRNADGTFRFPLTGDDFDPETRTGLVRAGGTVRFLGHSGLLDMTFTNPRVLVGTTSSRLYADVKSKSLNSGEVEHFPNVEFAALAGGAPANATPPVVLDKLPATLTQDGAPAFAGFYTEGTELDPVTITVTAWAPEPEPTATPQPTVTPDPTATPTATPDATATPMATPAPPASTPTPTPAATPAAVEAPAVTRVAALQTVTRSGVLRFASLTCPSAGCTISRPRTVKLKIGGRTYSARVTGPTKLAAGRAGELRLRLPKAAVRALGRRTVKARMTVTVTPAGGQRVTQTISTSFKLRKG